MGKFLRDFGLKFLSTVFCYLGFRIKLDFSLPVGGGCICPALSDVLMSRGPPQKGLIGEIGMYIYIYIYIYIYRYIYIMNIP